MSSFADIMHCWRLPLDRVLALALTSPLTQKTTRRGFLRKWASTWNLRRGLCDRESTSCLLCILWATDNRARIETSSRPSSERRLSIVPGKVGGNGYVALEARWEGESVRAGREIRTPRDGELAHVSIPEMGIRGWARVEAIQPCPTGITQLTDGTVTGTYRTSEADVVAVHLDGLPEPIAATPTRPFWSIDREDWTPAGELLPGETIGTYDGRAIVVAVIRREATTTVYNLEVYGTHTYFVSDAKAWVHNSYTAVPKAIVRLPNVPPEGANIGYMSPDGTAYLERFHVNVAQYLYEQGLWQSARSPGAPGWVYGMMKESGEFMGILLD